MFQILGWSVAAEQGALAAAAAPPEYPQLAFMQLEPTQLAFTQPQLALRAVGNIIEVASNDPGVATALAAAGLDRLVMPVALPTLEQLMVFAG